MAGDLSPAQEPGNAGLDGAWRQARALDELFTARNRAAHGHSRCVVRGPPAYDAGHGKHSALVSAVPAASDIHGWLGNVLIWLAGLHAAAALYHHFWRRDTVLLSMLPGR